MKKPIPKIKNKKLKTLIIAVAVAAAAVLAFNIFLAAGGRPVDSGSQKKVIVEIPQGSSTSQIADILADRDLIRSTFVFRLESKVRFYDEKYIAGTYAVSRSMSSGRIMKKMVSGDTAGKVFTVIEGQSLYKIAASLKKQGVIDTEKEFFDEVENGKFNYRFMKYLPDGPTRLEGFLYPDTYEVPVNADVHKVIDVMLAQFDKKVTSEYYEAAKKKGYNIYEIVTAASVIDREAKLEKDKKNVSSVIYNRLAVDMPLQMDSIISYINKEDKIVATYSDIAVDSDYNPYKNTGLPPGPICSPGLEDIKAALYPADTDYLYFVASPKMDGSDVFSETYKEFLKDKKAFNKAYKKYIKEHPEEE